jgi:probable phosphoglycerate mutase
MGKKVYFVRHGQTVANITGQTQGPDDPLNEEGIKQAGVIAQRAMKLDFECIISSDYPRAKVTAEAIRSATNKPLEFSELFREFRRPSEFWGRIPREDDEVLAGYKLISENFANDDWHFSDEENFKDLKLRGIQALNYLLSRKEENILVVTHGNFLRNLLGIILRGEESYSAQDSRDIESTFEAGNTSITIIKRKYYWRQESDTWMIETWNDCGHLR